MTAKCKKYKWKKKLLSLLIIHPCDREQMISLNDCKDQTSDRPTPIKQKTDSTDDHSEVKAPSPYRLLHRSVSRGGQRS